MFLKNSVALWWANQWVPLSVSPLFFATVACCAGIVARHYAVSIVFSGAGILGLCAVLLFLCKKSTKMLIAGISIVAFFGAYLRYDRVLTDHLNTYKQLPRQSFDAYAQVIDLEVKRGSRFTSKITVALSSCIKNGIQVPSNAHLVINLIQAPALCVGDSILIHRISHKPLTSRSFEQYLHKEGLTTSLYLPRLSYTLHKRPLYSLTRWRYNCRNRLAKRLSVALSPPCYTLFCTLFLGMKQSHSSYYKKLQTYCSYWGIMHYLSRSGLHALIVTGVLAWFLRFIPLHFFLKEGILVLGILLYHSLTWPSIAFVRALSTLLLYKLFTIGGSSYKTLQILSLITGGVLLINPLQLFSLDFQLSFGLTWTLAWFNEVRLVAKRTAPSASS